MVVTTRAPARTLTPGTVASLAQPFPLIARRAPVCGSLKERINQVAAALETPTIAGQTGAMITSCVLNRAAALASECQRPKEAYVILRQHLAVYAGQDSLSVPAAIAMLEPATDLARLHAMARHTDRALSWLNHLMHAVRTGTRATIDRYTLPLDRVHAEPGESELLQGWAWTRLLAAAATILARTGRWADASALITRHEGPGPRLTPTRQTWVVANMVGGDPAVARRYLAEAQPAEPWESEIASCLSVLVAEPEDRVEAADAMITVFQRSAPTPDLAAYRARYGSTVARLAHATGLPYAGIARQLAAEAISVGDGHAARNVLRTVAGCLSRKDIATLERNVARAGLNGREGLNDATLTGYNLTRLRTTTDLATTILQNTLR
ncbi:hypothetical protein [Promicromonospora soli]